MHLHFFQNEQAAPEQAPLERLHHNRVANVIILLGAMLA